MAVLCRYVASVLKWDDLVSWTYFVDPTSWLLTFCRGSVLLFSASLWSGETGRSFWVVAILLRSMALDWLLLSLSSLACRRARDPACNTWAHRADSGRLAASATSSGTQRRSFWARRSRSSGAAILILLLAHRLLRTKIHSSHHLHLDSYLSPALSNAHLPRSTTNVPNLVRLWQSLLSCARISAAS